MSEILEQQARQRSREMEQAWEKFNGLKKRPRGERLEHAALWEEHCRTDPKLIAERIGWVLRGQYGEGVGIIADHWVHKYKAPRAAKELFYWIACFEWSADQYYVKKIWGELTEEQKERIQKAIEGEIAKYLKMEKEEGRIYRDLQSN